MTTVPAGEAEGISRPERRSEMDALRALVVVGLPPAPVCAVWGLEVDDGGWPLPALLQYVVIVAVSLLLTVGLYDLLVRRTSATRFLFGMRSSTTEMSRLLSSGGSRRCR